MRWRRLFGWFLLLLFLLEITACKEPEKPLPPLLKVGTRQLTLERFGRELLVNYPDLSELPYPEQLQLKIQQVNRLIERELIYAEAERLDIRVSPDELDAEMQALRGNYTAGEYRQILREAGQTERSWKQILKQRLITRKVRESLLKAQPLVSEKEAESYYLSHKDQFRRPEELRARQMLFANLQDAEAILKRVKGGEEFAALAREHSLSPDRENGGNLGYFSRGELPPEFDKVLFTLGAGQLSDPVESPYGVHLFLVERRRRAGLRPYAAVKDEIIAQLSQQREEQAFQQWLEGLHETTQIKVNWDLLELKQD